MKNTIQLAGNLTPEHDAALSDYLRGAGRLTRAQWHCLREAIDLLAQSTVTVQGRNYMFTQFYETFIDQQFAEAFLQSLVATADVAQDAPRLQAATARQIVQGIEFFAHDITNRNERLSPFDLTVLGLRGDVKYSTWFLTVENARLTGLDFFITRLYDESGACWLRVVLLTPVAHDLIGNVATPPEASLALPATVTAGAALLLMIRYDDWKARVRFKQTPQGDSTNE